MIESYIRQLSKEYNVEIQLFENQRHIDIFPPQGGMMVTIYVMCVEDENIEIGSNYGTSFERMKQNALEGVRQHLNKRELPVLREKILSTEKTGIRNVLILSGIILAAFVAIVLLVPGMTQVRILYRALMIAALIAFVIVPMLITVTSRYRNVKALMSKGQCSIENVKLSITMLNTTDRAMGSRYIYNAEIDGKLYENIFLHYSVHDRDRSTLRMNLPIFNEDNQRKAVVVRGKKLYVYVVDAL